MPPKNPSIRAPLEQGRPEIRSFITAHRVRQCGFGEFPRCAGVRAAVTARGEEVVHGCPSDQSLGAQNRDRRRVRDFMRKSLIFEGETIAANRSKP